MFYQAKYESCNKFPKCFLDLRSSLKHSAINVTTLSHLTDIECKKFIKADPNKITVSAKKEESSLSSEALTTMFFCPVQIIADLDPQLQT